MQGRQENGANAVKVDPTQAHTWQTATMYGDKSQEVTLFTAHFVNTAPTSSRSSVFIFS